MHKLGDFLVFLLMVLLVVRHDGDPISINVSLLVAQSQHLSNLAQLIILKLLRVSFFDKSQLLQQYDTMRIICNFKTVGNLYNRASWIVLLEELHNRPSSNERRRILYNDYLWLRNEDSKNSYLFAKTSAQVFINLLDVCI